MDNNEKFHTHTDTQIIARTIIIIQVNNKLKKCDTG